MAADADGVVVFVNPAAESFLHRKAVALLGVPLHDLLHPDGAQVECDPGTCPLRGVERPPGPIRAPRGSFMTGNGDPLPVTYTLANTDDGGTVIVFDDITDQIAEQLRIERDLEKLAWVGRIRDALAEDRLVLFAQPVVDLHTSAGVAHEIFIRMTSPTGELIPPGEFLPTAEEFSLIIEIDRWVVRQAAGLAAAGHTIAFNLSAKSVAVPDMATFIRQTFEAAGAPPERGICEITETALLTDGPIAESFVRAISAAGLQVALDDFGVGYGGFSYLKRLPVAFLKIDREFVRDITESVASRHLVTAIVNLARGFGAKTVAEGAESSAAIAVLRELGVDHVQGFAVGRPAPLEATLGVATRQ